MGWNMQIRTHLANRDYSLVVSTYRQMLLRGVRPDNHTLPRVLTAARLSQSLVLGDQLHAQALKLAFSSHHYVLSALMELYGLLHSVRAAKKLFFSDPDPDLNSRGGRESPVFWCLLIKLHVLEGKPELAVAVFCHMLESGAGLDQVALTAALAASCRLSDPLQLGRGLHQIAVKSGLLSQLPVSNSLLKMYAHTADVNGVHQGARPFFNQMPARDAISWTTLVRGFVRSGGFNEALKLWGNMVAQGIRPDSLAISTVLPACARMPAHKNGKEIHGYLLRNRVPSNITVNNAIMDMYVKAGWLDSAALIFARMKERDVISWTIMILGYSLHGQGEVGVDLFRQMERCSPAISKNIDPTAYAAVLHACRTAGMVEEGKLYFNCIRVPQVSQCALMVSLMARAGLFSEANALMESQQLQRHPDMLRALLDGCRRHSRSTRLLGKQTIEHLRDLEPLNPNSYVLLTNWYAENEEWDMVEHLRETTRGMGLKPTKAYSWIEFRNKVHAFGTGDVSHPKSNEIYWELQCLTNKIFEEEEENDRQSDLDFSFHDVYEERECVPSAHSEMLALSFGLISTEAGTAIRLTKNQRVCQHCHYSAKFISKLVKREIILKDPNCFHHFRNGSCSCQDVW